LLGDGEVGVRLVNKPDSEVDRTENNQYYSWHSNTRRKNSKLPLKQVVTFLNKWSQTVRYLK